MQAYRGMGGLSKKQKKTNPYISLIIVFIKQELDNFETKPTEIKLMTMKTKNHRQKMISGNLQLYVQNFELHPVVKFEFLCNR